MKVYFRILIQMGKFVAGILVFLILTVSFSSLFTFTEYEINKDYIISAHCINKDRPELRCNGMCYLRKQLKQLDNGISPVNKPAPKKNKNNRTEVVYTFSPSSFGIEMAILSGECVVSLFVNHYSFLTSNIPFIPPRLH